MSASLHWAPIPHSADDLPALAPQRTMEILSEIGINFPGLANASHIPALRAISKAWPDHQHDPFAALANAIEQHGDLRLWAEY